MKGQRGPQREKVAGGGKWGRKVEILAEQEETKKWVKKKK